MELLAADYVLCGLLAVLGVTGLFRGISGTLSFFLASICGVVIAILGWPLLSGCLPVLWQRVLALVVIVFVAYGIVRIFVRNCVHFLLAQPMDAILGLILWMSFGGALVLGWAAWGCFLEYSNLVREIARFVGTLK